MSNTLWGSKLVQEFMKRKIHSPIIKKWEYIINIKKTKELFDHPTPAALFKNLFFWEKMKPWFFNFSYYLMSQFSWKYCWNFLSRSEDMKIFFLQYWLFSSVFFGFFHSSFSQKTDDNRWWHNGWSQNFLLSLTFNLFNLMLTSKLSKWFFPQFSRV